MGTAGFNFVTAAAAGLGGLIIARALGPTIRGEYAAVTAWFGILLVIGEMGQPVALVYYVASDPLRARNYVATARVMLLATGLITLAIGFMLAPVLARGRSPSPPPIVLPLARRWSALSEPASQPRFRRGISASGTWCGSPSQQQA